MNPAGNWLAIRRILLLAEQYGFRPAELDETLEQYENALAQHIALNTEQKAA